MPYEQVSIDGTWLVRVVDGKEVERRPATQQELTVPPPPPPDPTEVTRATLTEQALAAMVGNRSFVAIASPSNAQNAAQIKALSRQINGVMRLLLNQLEATD
jgi:hypothetical protein